MTDANKIIDINHNQKVAKKLQDFIDQSYAALITTQNLHWNVEGEKFYSVHKLTEEIYNELFAAIDEIAERLRAIGHKAYVNYSSSAKDVSIKDVMESQLACAQTAQELIEAAQEIGDEVTVGLATDRLEVHQKTAWMLKSQSK